MGGALSFRTAAKVMLTTSAVLFLPAGSFGTAWITSGARIPAASAATVTTLPRLPEGKPPVQEPGIGIVSKFLADHHISLAPPQPVDSAAHLTVVRKPQPMPRQPAPVTPVPAVATPVPAGTAQAEALQILDDDGWGNQFGCLNSVIDAESSWNVHAENPGSGAYGIPQALPGSKMAVAGPDWQNSAHTQLEWMINDYIKPVYGTPCAAWAHEEADGWY